MEEERDRGEFLITENNIIESCSSCNLIRMENLRSSSVIQEIQGQPALRETVPLKEERKWLVIVVHAFIPSIQKQTGGSLEFKTNFVDL